MWWWQHQQLLLLVTFFSFSFSVFFPAGDEVPEGAGVVLSASYAQQPSQQASPIGGGCSSCGGGGGGCGGGGGYGGLGLRRLHGDFLGHPLDHTLLEDLL